ncbi:MAG TPA: hypothetical protein VGQ26_29490 [Streptosporangiaceae bacterium]|jgi:hypothetical protein|nr:hypothetical protein [Streptosporangiaceae bacterium]
MDDRLTRIREEPASPAAQRLLSQVLYEVLEDAPKLTSIDVARLRAVAAMLSDVAQYQLSAERAAAKAGAALTDRLADVLAELGEIAAREFGGW